MLNKEKFKDEIFEIACSGSRIALKDGKLTACADMDCDECGFHPGCKKECKEWANSEYIEPPVDWTKVPVDTPILVKDTEGDDWKNRYFAEYKNGTVYAWCNGATSWSSKNDKCDWEYAKLAESEG